jgi:hypothetical protein
VVKFTLPVARPSVADALHAAYVRRAEDWRRDHLGASLIGHKCDRDLWLVFRWALDPKHPGKRLRLFARGEREEAWIVEDLREAGFEVVDRDPSTGEQFRIPGPSHVGGSLDGLIRGVPEAPKSWHVLEVKTHNLKSFDRLVEKGVKASKPEHWTQMQVYMRGLRYQGERVDRALYIAVCKDDDRIYTERVVYEADKATAIVERAERVVALVEPPKRLTPDYPPCVYTSQDGTRWPCQFFELCHGQRLPQRNCRTCEHARVEPQGAWSCARYGGPLDSNDQRVGCASHSIIQSIVNADVCGVNEETGKTVFQFADGSTAE